MPKYIFDSGGQVQLEELIIFIASFDSSFIYDTISNKTCFVQFISQFYEKDSLHIL
jgi:hypothetical protein